MTYLLSSVSAILYEKRTISLHVRNVNHGIQDTYTLDIFRHMCYASINLTIKIFESQIY